MDIRIAWGHPGENVEGHPVSGRSATTDDEVAHVDGRDVREVGPSSHDPLALPVSGGPPGRRRRCQGDPRAGRFLLGSSPTSTRAKTWSTPWRARVRRLGSFVRTNWKFPARSMAWISKTACAI